MRSYRTRVPRRIPRQERGERRVAALIDAAACVIDEVGYEAATMSEIASRAGACIGSLYQFFPNKRSLTYALRADYAAGIQQLWEPLEQEAARLTLDQLIGHMIDSMAKFADEHPAFLRLLDAPCSTRNPSMRTMFREMVARILSTKLNLSWPRLIRVSSVTLQVFKAMNELYAETPTGDRPRVIGEFKIMLRCYFAAQPGISHPTRKSKTK